MQKKRGEFGYIRAKKLRSALWTLLMAVIGVAVFLVGFFLNDMSNRNIFTIFAMLFVLPAAKFMVALIVVFPYASVSRERYEAVKSVLPEGMTLYTDLVITSSEKIMNLDFAVVGFGQVIAVVGQKKKQEIPYIRSYLTKGVQNWGDGYRVKILESEKMFLSEIKRVEPCEVDEDEEKHVKSYLVSLIV